MVLIRFSKSKDFGHTINSYAFKLKKAKLKIGDSNEMCNIKFI